MRTATLVRAACACATSAVCVASPLPPLLSATSISARRVPAAATILMLRGGSLRNPKIVTPRKATHASSVDTKVLTKKQVYERVGIAMGVVFVAVIGASDVAGLYFGKIVARTLTTMKARLLVLMVFQNACTVLVGRYTRASKSPEDAYVINHLVLTCEAVKFVLSSILEYRATDGQLWQSVKDNAIVHPMNSIKIVIPSLLYLVQNSLQYVALSNLSAPLFQVTYQAKLLTTALASVLLLHRHYTPKQWLCLTSLGIGVAIVVLGESSLQQKPKATTKKGRKRSKAAVDEEDPKQNLVVGLSAVIVACVSSALASVYLEKVLKKPAADSTAFKPVSLWMFNMQMAFFSACIAGIQALNLKGAEAEKPFLHGFTPWVWALVLLQSGGGLLVAAVMKYADNVLKGLATGVSVVVSTSLSTALFNTPLTRQFSLGACVILASAYFFTN